MAEITVKLNIDFEALQEQKNAIIELQNYVDTDFHTNALLSMLNIIDEIQDQAVDNNGIDENIVFKFEEGE